MFEFTALFAALLSFVTSCDGANISPDLNVGINKTKSCLWSCAARNNNFGQAMSAEINQSQLTTLQVELEKQEQPMCGKQKSGNSSKLVILSWIWIATQAHIEEEDLRLLGSVASSMSHGRKVTVAVSCSFQESARTAEGNITASSSSLNEQVARVLADEIMKLSTFESKLGSLCYKTAHNNPYTCVDLMELKRSDVNRPRSEQEECGVLESIFVAAFAMVVLLYSAAVFCLFSLDESLTEEGVRLMDLEGPSPRGFRIFVARRFFSRNGTGSILHKMITFLCLALILPLLVYLILLTASWYTNTEYQLNVLQLGLGGYISSRSRKLLFITCYILRCLVFSFQSTNRFCKECFMCNTCAQSQDNHIHDSFPNAIKCHLLLQLELIKIICTVSILSLKNFLQGCFSFVRNPLFRVRVRHLILKAFSYAGVWIIIAMFFINASPVVHLVWCLVDCAEYSIVTGKRGLALFILTLVIEFIQNAVVIVGMVDIYKDIVLFVYIAIVQSVCNLVFSPEEFLPYIACFVVIVFNLWNCYSSFSDDYQNLKLKIFQCCKAEQGQSAAEGDLERKRKLIYQDDEGALQIPEELYDIVCTKLMPVSQSFCKMLLKALSLLAFVILVFSMILSHGKRSEIRPGFQAVATFFTGIMPKLAMLGAMFMGGKMGAVLREVALENKLRRIVLQYAKWEILQLASNPRETEI